MRWGCSRRPVRPLALYTLRRSYAATTNPGNESLKDHFGAIDAKWQARWQQPQHQPSPVKDVKKGKAYILPMFPYPSGNLHLGHLRVYTISDVLARFKQMQGYDVIHPIGWDAFGLPAENAAIERGVSPALWTLQNIASMKKQMKVMGGRWDWDREILTCDPSFYKHTQKLFLLLHERGLAYQAESMVNFDPVDKTVLANEQVDANGCSWRSGAKVQKIMLKQWFLKIKEFQQPLLDDLEVLAKGNKWPERVLTMQKHWLGKSEGAKIRFQLENTDGTRSWPEVEVYTTRIDTLFGAQYLALSTSHPIVTKLAETHKQLHDFVQGARKLPSDSKDGYKLPEIRAKNPLFSAGLVGLENVPEWIPVYTAPYVLDHYGSGAVMGIPGHDTRDNDFRQENTHSPANVKIVVTAEKGASSKQTVDTTSAASKVDTAKPFTNKGYVTEGFGKFSGMASDEASDVIIEALRTNNVFAEKAENWRLRDWLISRQRYWGTPIPIIHCDTCGPVPVPDSDLPIELPALADEYFIGKAGNPLQNIQGWKNTACPKCNAPAERETDTMDTFMDSSWYFMRFLDPANTAAPISSQKADAGLPVDVYVGGVEHAILHLLYARFISKFLATTPLWPSGGGSENRAEPFKQLITQGMVHGKTYSDPSNGRFLRPNEVDFTDSRGPRIKSSGLEPVVSYEKMSKSKYNGVDPGETIATHGADATRAHMLFQAPVSEVLEWNPNSISGIKRWFTRILRLSAGPWIPTTILENGFIPPKDQDTSLLEILKRFHPSDKPADPRSRELTPDESLVQALTPKEVELWLKTQSTIASVTDSYSNTHALNTVVSDLMSLTNRLWDTQSLYNSGSQLSCTLRYLSFTSLLRMLAPIAPAFAEECWERLHEVVARKQVDQVDHPLHAPEPTSEISYVRSIFSFGFPIHDPHIVKLLSPTQTCAVMIDGRLKFTTEIPMPPADLTSEVDEGGEAKRDNKAVVREWIRQTEELRGWAVSAIRKTEEGEKWFGEGGKLGWPKEEDCVGPYWTGVEGMQVVVVKNGKTVNFVTPKPEKKKKKGAEGTEASPAAGKRESVEESEFEAKAIQTNSSDVGGSGEVEGADESFDDMGRRLSRKQRRALIHAEKQAAKMIGKLQKRQEKVRDLERARQQSSTSNAEQLPASSLLSETPPRNNGIAGPSASKPPEAPRIPRHTYGALATGFAQQILDGWADWKEIDSLPPELKEKLTKRAEAQLRRRQKRLERQLRERERVARRVALELTRPERLVQWHENELKRRAKQAELELRKTEIELETWEKRAEFEMRRAQRHAARRRQGREGYRDMELPELERRAALESENMAKEELERRAEIELERKTEDNLKLREMRLGEEEKPSRKKMHWLGRGNVRRRKERVEREANSKREE